MSLEQSDVPRYLNDTRFVVLATTGLDSAPATRTLASFAADGLVVYFSTGRSTEKVRQIQANPSVAVLFQHEQQDLKTFVNVTIRGTAAPLVQGEEEHGKAIRLIGARNPRFKDRAEKGQLGESLLFRVEPKELKVVDFSRGHGPAAVRSIAV